MRTEVRPLGSLGDFQKWSGLVWVLKRDFWKGHTTLHCDTWVTSDVCTYMHTQASDTIAFILIHKTYTVLLTNIMHIYPHRQMVTNANTNQ